MHRLLCIYPAEPDQPRLKCPKEDSLHHSSIISRSIITVSSYKTIHPSPRIMHQSLHQSVGTQGNDVPIPSNTFSSPAILLQFESPQNATSLDLKFDMLRINKFLPLFQIVSTTALRISFVLSTPSYHHPIVRWAPICGHTRVDVRIPTAEWNSSLGSLKLEDAVFHCPCSIDTCIVINETGSFNSFLSYLMRREQCTLYVMCVYSA